MDLTQTIVLALIQGLTEFLPISSSAHLILLPIMVGWEDQGLTFDVAVHVGTLFAIVFYFRRQLQAMLKDWLQSFAGAGATANSKLVWYLAIATIPVGIVGLLFNDYAATILRNPIIIASSTIIFALLLWIIDKVSPKNRNELQMKTLDAVIIGISQAIAIIPGTSRSGISITGGLYRGLSREAAARFAFLMAIPVIVLAGGLKGYELWQQPTATNLKLIALATLISFISAYISVHFFLKLINKIGLTPFIWYRLLLGVVILVAFWQSPT